MGCTQSNSKTSINPKKIPAGARSNFSPEALEEAERMAMDKSSAQLFLPDDLHSGGPSGTMAASTALTKGSQQQSVNKTNEDPNRQNIVFEDPAYPNILIRQDLSTSKMAATPKNQIDLIKMSDQLLKYLEDVCQQKGITGGGGKTLIKQKSASSITDKILSGRTSQRPEKRSLEIQQPAEAILSKSLNESIAEMNSSLENGKDNMPPEEMGPPEFVAAQKELLTKNTFKVQNRLDEMSYCKYLASQQIVYFKQDVFFVDLFIQLIKQMKKKIQILLIAQDQQWYGKYCRIIVNQLYELATPLRLIQTNPTLLKEYTQSIEMLLLYSSLLATMRFLEGISWGYSPMFLHNTPDKEITLSVKVNLNMLIMIKQTFRENPTLSQCLNELDIKSLYLPRESFLTTQSALSLIVDLDKRQSGVFLKQQVFRKTYVQIKRSIDDWLRVKNMTRLAIVEADDAKKQSSNKAKNAKELVSVQELIVYRQHYKTFTKNRIRALKRPPNFPSLKQNHHNSMMTSNYHTYSSVNVTENEEEKINLSINQASRLQAQNLRAGGDQPQQKCSYEIENSKQILLLTGEDHEELRVIVESFLQANVNIRTKYKCVVLHHCLEENPITCDSYYIVKNIMHQILRTLPFVGQYLQIADSRQFTQVIEEMMSTDLNEIGGEYLTEHNYPAIFVKFVKRINEMRLDFNIAIFITGIEYTMTLDGGGDDLQSIVYLLRSASVYLHKNSFLKFILTMKKYSDPTAKNKKDEKGRRSDSQDVNASKDSKRSKQSKAAYEVTEPEDPVMNDKRYVSVVLEPMTRRYERIKAILQTGAVCHVQDQTFWQKNSKSFAEFAISYLFGKELKNLVELALARANKSYKDLIQIIATLTHLDKGSSEEAIAAQIEAFTPQSAVFKQCFKALSKEYGLAVAIQIVTLLLENGPILFSDLLKHLDQQIEKINAFSTVDKKQQAQKIGSTENDLLGLQKRIYQLADGNQEKSLKAVDPVKVMQIIQPMIVTKDCHWQRKFQEVFQGHELQQEQISELKQALKEVNCAILEGGIAETHHQTRIHINLSQHYHNAKPNKIIFLKNRHLLKHVLLECMREDIKEDQFNHKLLNKNTQISVIKGDGILKSQVSEGSKTRKEGDFDAIPMAPKDPHDATAEPKDDRFGPNSNQFKNLTIYQIYEHFQFISIYLIITHRPNLKEMLQDSVRWQKHVSKNKLEHNHHLLLYMPQHLQAMKQQMLLNALMDAQLHGLLFDNQQLKRLHQDFYKRWQVHPSFLLKPDVLYLLIRDVYKSFQRFLSSLRIYAQSFGKSEYRQGKMTQIFEFCNILSTIEETLSQNDTFKYAEFLTQLRGRVLKEKVYCQLMDIPSNKDSDIDLFLQKFREGVYFETFHHSLRENQRLELTLKMPGCHVLTVKFLSKTQIFISLSNGLTILFNSLHCTIEKVFANKGAIIDCIKILAPTYLITAGIDSKIRMWDIKSEKLFGKYEIHKYATQQLIVHNSILYSYGGHDMKLVKFDIACKETDCWINLKSHVTALKCLKHRPRTSEDMESQGQQPSTSNDLQETLIAAAFHDFDVVLYDLDLNQLQQINLHNMTPGDEVIRILRSGEQEIMCFSNEGTINVLSANNLEEIKSGTIFSLKNEDYIDLLLIKSREYFLFTIERSKIEFYSASQLRRTDCWEYFFQTNIICCDKNREGSKILVGDKQCNLILFNFMKHLDTSKEKQVPANRRHDPVVSIEITTSAMKQDLAAALHPEEEEESNEETIQDTTPEDNQRRSRSTRNVRGGRHWIISCSQDRDLRIWNRLDGMFIKKYDLSSFLAENVQCIKLGQNEDNLFLGSKDMNVYLIDINKGKLCVVYESHYNKVTNIYTVPNTDVLITLSESNIKIWDLQEDECIRNMNEHSSSVIFIENSKDDPDKVLTIGDQFEMKTWDYKEGAISSQSEIDLQKDKRTMRTLQILCCDVSEGVAYLAMNNCEISMYDLRLNRVLHTFKAWKNEEVVFIKAYKKYLLVVYRTVVELYQIQADNSIKTICNYLMNPKKSPSYKYKNQNYQNDSRYYFTSARLEIIQEAQADTIKTKAEILALVDQISESDQEGQIQQLCQVYMGLEPSQEVSDQEMEQVVVAQPGQHSEYQNIQKAGTSQPNIPTDNSIQNKNVLRVDLTDNSLDHEVDTHKDISKVLHGNEEQKIDKAQKRRSQQQKNLQQKSGSIASAVSHSEFFQPKGVKHIKEKQKHHQEAGDVPFLTEFQKLKQIIHFLKKYLGSHEVPNWRDVDSSVKSQICKYLESVDIQVAPPSAIGTKILLCVGDSKGCIHMCWLKMD